MTEISRPKHVVVLDAENPMQEISGEFFWREDHESLLAQATEHAFREGYARGWNDHTELAARSSSAAAMPVRVRIRRRRHRMFRTLFVLVAGAYAVSLIAALLR
ncbi:hypothetical protein ACVW00_003560 [Marmoricola sp. URHA0025 HA25]